jgi:hypothetical protein
LASLKAKQIEGRWKNKKDSIGKRFASKLLRGYSENDILMKAILEDDLNFIKDQIEEREFSKDGIPLFCFEAACLCGSESIALYLLESRIVRICDSDEAVAYALSSRNMDFAYKIAKVAKEGGHTDIGLALIYPFGKYSDYEKIRKFLIEGEENPS